MLQVFNQYEMIYAELPFEVEISQVVFIDNGSCHELNDFVKSNLPALKHIFRHRKLEFCYMPAMFDDVMELEGKILYRMPWLKEVDYEKILKLRAIQSEEIESVVHGHSTDAEVVIREQDEKVLIKIDVSRPELYMEQFQHIARRYGDKISHALYSEQSSDPDIINLFFTLMEKKPKGVVREAIEKALVDEDVLSRVVIKKNCNVFLPEYNRMIKMRPMEKTLFFFYLRHPEGIAFKDLIDYRSEIYHIYGHLTNQSDLERIGASVDRLFELDSNAINEHRSRLKSAFEREFDSALAQQYYITGKKGETMNITLPRELVSWEIQF